MVFLRPFAIVVQLSDDGENRLAVFGQAAIEFFRPQIEGLYRFVVSRQVRQRDVMVGITAPPFRFKHPAMRRKIVARLHDNFSACDLNDATFIETPQVTPGAIHPWRSQQRAIA
jgi:hypothetical protein